MDEGPYEIRETPPYLADLEKLRKRVKRIDDFVQGARVILERDPSLGQTTANPYMRMLPMDTDEGEPNVALYYCYGKKDRFVLLIGLRAADDDRAQEIFM